MERKMKDNMQVLDIVVEAILKSRYSAIIQKDKNICSIVYFVDITMET